jgi:hypothetical protein
MQENPKERSGCRWEVNVEMEHQEIGWGILD